MAARFSGTWREGGDGSAGIADIQGNFSRASIGAIERYLPKFLNQDAHDWMSKGLVAGTIRDARVLLRGDLDYFPFDDHPDKGEFHVQGSYSDGVVDYAPAAGGQPGWPRLPALSGRAALDRAVLRPVAVTAALVPAKGRPIQLRKKRKRIPDLNPESILRIPGD